MRPFDVFHVVELAGTKPKPKPMPVQCRPSNGTRWNKSFSAVDEVYVLIVGI